MDLQQILDTVVDHRPTLQRASGQYAVLVPLVKREDGYHLLYELRAPSLRHQPGEVCFPGGHMEDDESPEDCAVRETCEELGVDCADIHIIAPLDFLTRGSSIIFPILAEISPDYERKLNLNPCEVSSLFTVSLSWLRDHPPAFYQFSCRPSFTDFPYEELGVTRDYPWLPLEMEVPVYSGLPHPLWGMTARITSHLVRTLYNGKGG